MILRNTGSDPVTLVGLETPLAMMPDIHETTTDLNGVSSMGLSVKSPFFRAKVFRWNRAACMPC